MGTTSKTNGTSSEINGTETTQAVTVTEDKLKQASNIIISDICDHALSSVRYLIVNPCAIMKKLDKQ